MEQDELVVEDLRSANGTLLNGQPVVKASLVPGDTLTIGNTQLAYAVGDETDPTTPTKKSKNSCGKSSRATSRKSRGASCRKSKKQMIRRRRKMMTCRRRRKRSRQPEAATESSCLRGGPEAMVERQAFYLRINGVIQRNGLPRSSTRTSESIRA